MRQAPIAKGKLKADSFALLRAIALPRQSTSIVGLMAQRRGKLTSQCLIAWQHNATSKGNDMSKSICEHYAKPSADCPGDMAVIPFALGKEMEKENITYRAEIDRLREQNAALVEALGECANALERIHERKLVPFHVVDVGYGAQKARAALAANK